jgi:hypothetical protein
MLEGMGWPPSSDFELHDQATCQRAKAELLHGPAIDMPRLQAAHEGDHSGDNAGQVKITRSAYVFVLCAAVNSTNLGYDIGASTSAGKLIQKDMNLTRMQREIFVGSLNLWASKFTVLWD